MAKQILTLDMLYQFFVNKNETVNFNIKDSGKPIVVRTDGFFEAEEDDMPGMLKLKLKVCHTEVNRNGSNISKENMEKAMPTLKYRPILAYIHELPDGTKDFYAHNMEIVENEDGDAEIVYIEKQVGCFTADKPWLEYDEDMDKTYVMAYAVIPEDYTEAADIIRRKNGTKVSCELVINELSYNAKEKYLDLTDFYFGGTTLLGCDENGKEIGEGMLGARADISDFCYKEPVFTYQDKMIEVLEKLNTTLSNFNNSKNDQKGGSAMNKFEELLAQYGIVAEDVTFEVEGLSDEELEAKFKETFDEESGDEAEGSVNDGGDGDGESDDDGDNDDTDDDDDNDDNDTSSEGDSVAVVNSNEDSSFESRKSYATDDSGNVTITFEISHEDIRGALNSLICVYDEEDNDWYWVTNVYNDYFIFENWFGDKLYKQSYTVDGDNVALSGDRQEMFKMILSESEKLAIEKMREDYSALEIKYNELKAFKENYEADRLKAEKEAILESAEYSEIKESDEFKTLVTDAEKYSVEELKVKADLLFAASMKKKFAVETEKVEKHSVGMNFNTEPDKKKQAYAGLFDN